MLDDLELTAEDVAGKKFYRGSGCDVCNNTGYKGRVGLFELMIMNDELRDMIMRQLPRPTNSARPPQARHGHPPRRRHGTLLRRRHHAEEVIRETIMEA